MSAIGKSGNIYVAGRTLSSAAYGLVAPLLGLSVDERAARSVGVSSLADFRTRLQARASQPIAQFVINSNCNRSCGICFLDRPSHRSDSLDWESLAQSVRSAGQRGFQTKIYPKEFNADDVVFSRSLEMMRLAQETFVITNGERPFAPWQLAEIANSPLKKIVVTFGLVDTMRTVYGSQNWMAVRNTIRGLADFKNHLARPISIGIFTQLPAESAGQALMALANEAFALGVDSVNYRLTLPLGRNDSATNRESANQQAEEVLLSLIDARSKFPKERLQLLLSSATFGPNYFAPGIWRYQLGQADPYYSSRFPCPFMDAGSYTVLFPENERIYCQVLGGKKAQGLSLAGVVALQQQDPSNLCRACDVKEICGGGCVATKANAEQRICLTDIIRRWIR